MTLAAPSSDLPQPRLRQVRLRLALPRLGLPEGLALPVAVTLVAALLGALPFLRLAVAAFAPGGAFAPGRSVQHLTHFGGGGGFLFAVVCGGAQELRHRLRLVGDNFAVARGV